MHVEKCPACPSLFYRWTVVDRNNPAKHRNILSSWNNNSVELIPDVLLDLSLSSIPESVLWHPTKGGVLANTLSRDIGTQVLGRSTAKLYIVSLCDLYFQMNLMLEKGVSLFHTNLRIFLHTYIPPQQLSWRRCAELIMTSCHIFLKIHLTYQIM